MFEQLGSYGITPAMLQIGIVAGFAIFLFGMFWKYIMIGSGILFCVYVFVMPTSAKDTKQPESAMTAVVEKDDTPIEYIQDCIRLTGKNDFDCKLLWNARSENE
jgi:hypothetical protein